MKQGIELKIILSSLSPPYSTFKELITDPTVNWKSLYTMIIRHRVCYQVYEALNALKLKASIPIYDQLANYCQNNQRSILAKASETLRIARGFTEQKIQHCFVKGTILNEYLYGALNTRPCKDIDAWVDNDDYQRAEDLLLSLGYEKKSPCYTLTGFKKRYYMRTKYDMAFYHPIRKILVELHFRLDKNEGSLFFKPTQAILMQIPLLNKPVMTLKNDYNLLYLMIHGATHAWIRLRWLNDIALYIKREKCSLTNVMALAKDIHSEHIVRQTLMLVRDLFKIETPIMNTLLLHPSKREIKLVKLSKAFIASDYEFGDGQGIFDKHFFLYRLYIATLAISGQKLNAVLGDLFKIDKLFPYVTFSDGLAFMYYLVYPFWIVKYVIFRR